MSPINMKTKELFMSIRNWPHKMFWKQQTCSRMTHHNYEDFRRKYADDTIL